MAFYLIVLFGCFDLLVLGCCGQVELSVLIFAFNFDYWMASVYCCVCYGYLVFGVLCRD